MEYKLHKSCAVLLFSVIGIGVVIGVGVSCVIAIIAALIYRFTRTNRFGLLHCVIECSYYNVKIEPGVCWLRQ